MEEGRWLTGKSYRRRRRSGGLMAAEHGGSGEWRSETVARGQNARRLRWTAAARAFHARADAKLWKALSASSGLRLQRGRWLRLRLNERNTMVALHARDYQRLGRYGRFTKTAKTESMRFRRLPRLTIGGNELSLVMACGGSSNDNSLQFIIPISLTSLFSFPILLMFWRKQSG